MALLMEGTEGTVMIRGRKETPLIVDSDHHLCLWMCPEPGCTKAATSVGTLQDHIDWRHIPPEERAIKRRRNRDGKALTCYGFLMVFRSKATAAAHFKSTKHLRKESYQLGSGCDLCKLKLSNTNYLAHVESRSHANNSLTTQQLQARFGFHSTHPHKKNARSAKHPTTHSNSTP